MSAQYGPVGMAMAFSLNGFEEPMMSRGRGGKMTGFFPAIPTIMDLQNMFSSPSELFAALRAGDDSFAYREAKNLIPFGSAIMDLTELYVRQGMYDEATEMHLRLRVGRDWMGLDHLVAKAYGEKGLSIGSPVPGYRLYPVDPVRVAARRKSRALGYLPDDPY